MRFRSSLFIITAVLSTTMALPALAVEVSDDIKAVLWCGHAFTITSEQFKDQDPAAALEISKRGEEFLARSAAMMTEAGISEADIVATTESFKTTVTTEVAGTGENATYTYDECAALAE